jgi:hypothetical protein
MKIHRARTRKSQISFEDMVSRSSVPNTLRGAGYRTNRQQRECGRYAPTPVSSTAAPLYEREALTPYTHGSTRRSCRARPLGQSRPTRSSGKSTSAKILVLHHSLRFQFLPWIPHARWTALRQSARQEDHYCGSRWRGQDETAARPYLPRARR